MQQRLYDAMDPNITKKFNEMIVGIIENEMIKQQLPGCLSSAQNFANLGVDLLKNIEDIKIGNEELESFCKNYFQKDRVDIIWKNTIDKLIQNTNDINRKSSLTTLKTYDNVALVVKQAFSRSFINKVDDRSKIIIQMVNTNLANNPDYKPNEQKL
ncbi:MAG: hypothetical protein KBD37_02010 [Burkholderiales bacterium]|nr:hypothetical protein [Burkholderiales bacterium]